MSNDVEDSGMPRPEDFAPATSAPSPEDAPAPKVPVVPETPAESNPPTDVDEQGVPWTNRMAEFERKSAKLMDEKFSAFEDKIAALVTPAESAPTETASEPNEYEKFNNFQAQNSEMTYQEAYDAYVSQRARPLVQESKPDPRISEFEGRMKAMESQFKTSQDAQVDAYIQQQVIAAKAVPGALGIDVEIAEGRWYKEDCKKPLTDYVTVIKDARLKREAATFKVWQEKGEANPVPPTPSPDNTPPSTNVKGDKFPDLGTDEFVSDIAQALKDGPPK